MRILYQDKQIAVVEKPAGLAVQGGEGVRTALPEILSARLGQPVFPVHRLDKDTAGILVVALSKSAAALYSEYFREKRIQKGYHALCLHCPEAASGIFRRPLEKKNGPSAGTMQDAVTHFTVEKASPDGAFSLLSLRIETGRMHQIRRHLADAGFPIAADDKYGDFRRNREIRRVYGIRRLQLAATSLALPVFSGTEERIQRLTCPLPQHMQDAAAAVFPAGDRLPDG